MWWGGWGSSLRGRGVSGASLRRGEGDGGGVLYGCVWKVGGGGYLPLLSDARFLGFERLGECGDSIKGGCGEGGVGEEGAVGCHVVLAPLEMASWFWGRREVLGYRFTIPDLE